MEGKRKPKLIVALDVDRDLVDRVLERLGGEQVWYKVGYRLFLQGGPEVVHYLKSRGKKVFLDLKFHDIPNTMYYAIVSSSQLGVDMVNVHISAGLASLKAVKRALDEVKPRPICVGVTRLTSEESDPAQVIAMAELARSVGLDGVVCSVWEVEGVKRAYGSDFITVCPGIRLAGEETGDQRRVATPEDAQKAGADYIVMGRSVLGRLS